MFFFSKSDAWSGDLVTSYLEVSKNSTVADGNGNRHKLFYTDTAFLKSAQASKLYLDNTSTGLTWTAVNESGGASSSIGTANGVKNAVGPIAVSATAGATAVRATPADYAAAQVNNYAASAIPVLTDTGMATGSQSGLCTAGSIAPFATVNADEIVQVDIYVWMEGCDYDTVAGNLSSFSAATLNGIQFGFCAGAAN